MAPATQELIASAGETASLSCTYSAAVDNLQWYRHNLGSNPFIILLLESTDFKVESTPPKV